MVREIKDRKLFITINETKDHLIAEIIDNAGGLEPEILSTIFDSNDSTWTQDTKKNVFYIPKVILKNMKGSISADNIGDGTQYRLSVPKTAS
ncbi:hypothetical protein BIV60_10505 [Bacillus sp. MUM 116]|nr:hypothetical protein BIV60_10505 [Bacillus sp. MUM 116]